MKKLVAFAVSAALSAVGIGFVAAPAGADPGTGQYISDTFYGNTSNPRPSGNGVLPSLSPGPWVCTYDGGCTGAEMGNPVGAYLGGGTPVGSAQGTFPFDVRSDAIYG